jgi:hypothetical protein
LAKGVPRLIEWTQSLGFAVWTFVGPRQGGAFSCSSKCTGPSSMSPAYSVGLCHTQEGVAPHDCISFSLAIVFAAACPLQYGRPGVMHLALARALSLRQSPQQSSSANWTANATSFRWAVPAAPSHRHGSRAAPRHPADRPGSITAAFLHRGVRLLHIMQHSKLLKPAMTAPHCFTSHRSLMFVASPARCRQT